MVFEIRNLDSIFKGLHSSEKNLSCQQEKFDVIINPSAYGHFQHRIVPNLMLFKIVKIRRLTICVTLAGCRLQPDADGRHRHLRHEQAGAGRRRRGQGGLARHRQQEPRAGAEGDNFASRVHFIRQLNRFSKRP